MKKEIKTRSNEVIDPIIHLDNNLSIIEEYTITLKVILGEIQSGVDTQFTRSFIEADSEINKITDSLQMFRYLTTQSIKAHMNLEDSLNEDDYGNGYSKFVEEPEDISNDTDNNNNMLNIFNPESLKSLFRMSLQWILGIVGMFMCLSFLNDFNTTRLITGIIAFLGAIYFSNNPINEERENYHEYL